VDHPNYPSLIFARNHRVGGVVELSTFGEEFGYDIVGRPLPAYDFLDYSVSATPTAFDGEFKGTDKGGFSGVFWDFGLQNNLTLTGLAALPEGTNVYGALRLTSNISAASIAGVITTIENELDGGKVTGLFIADNRIPTIPSSLWGSGNTSANHRYGLPFVMSTAWTAQVDISAVTMSLFDLERIVDAGVIGALNTAQPILGRTHKIWPETTFNGYGVLPAESGDPDLVIVLTAHLDGVACSPSANDDGSGVATLVEVARRLSGISNGNVEVIFAAVGGEEHSDHNGAFWVIDELLRATGKDKIAININMDMIAAAADTVRSNGAAVNSFTFGIVNRLANAYNLPLYLVTENFATWGGRFPSQPAHVTSHSISRGTSVSLGYDHGAFGYYDIENFGLYHPLEYQYHSALDDMTNYCIERHRYATNIVHAAVLKAIKDQVSKRAHFDVNFVGGGVEAVLAGADSMFVTYDRVTADFVGADSGATFSLEFTPGSIVNMLPDDDYTVSNARGYATASPVPSSVATSTLNRSFSSILDPVINLPPTVYVSVVADDETHLTNMVEYNLALREAKNVLAVDVEFEIDGSLLSANSFETLNGFEVLEAVKWTDNGDGTWTGAVRFGFPGEKGFTADPYTDVAKFIFDAKAVGEADFTITKIKITGLDERGELDKVCYYNVVVEEGIGTVVIINKYDLNKDGFIDLIDLGIMLLYVGYNEDDPDWDTLVKVYDKNGKGITPKDCDVNGDGEIDMADIVELLANMS